MDKEIFYGILKEVVATVDLQEGRPSALPDAFDPARTLSSSGISLEDLPDIAAELKARLGGRNLGLEAFVSPEEFGYATLGNLVDTALSRLGPSIRNPVVVYVDDEEENLFIFKRRFGKELNLKAFIDPAEALRFIRGNNDVGLVVTDEVMPGLSGNALCDEVHRAKPNLPFILITGNPHNDGNLMYRSLRQNRFFEFINKPLDLEHKAEEYLDLMKKVLRA